MSRSADRRMRCGLCGHEFDAGGLACHAECPLGPTCNLICCPSCGYQVVDETRSRVAVALRRLIRADVLRPGPRARRPPEEGAVPLTHIPRGTEVEVRSLKGMSASRSARLSAFGLTPGSRVRIMQRRPVPVVRIGETELAVSDEILSEVWVAPPHPVA